MRLRTVLSLSVVIVVVSATTAFAWCDEDAEKRWDTVAESQADCHDKVAEARALCTQELWAVFRNPKVTKDARDYAWTRCLGHHLMIMRATNEQVKGAFSGEPVAPPPPPPPPPAIDYPIDEHSDEILPNKGNGWLK